jgi:arginyl-tRNA synthetase
MYPEDPLAVFEKAVRDKLARALAALGVSERGIKLEQPPPALGDYAFPCYHLAAQLRESATVLAVRLAEQLAPCERIAKCSAQGAYVNFHINARALAERTLPTILARDARYGHWRAKKRKIILEHTSANPTGPLHVGRGRNPIIGDTLARVLRAYGYDVLTEFWVNDLGKQAAMLVYGMEHFARESRAEKEKADQRLVKSYQRAYALAERDPQVLREVESFLVRCERGEREALGKVRRYCAEALAGIKETLHALNVEIDNYVWESAVVENGRVGEVIEKLKKSGFCGVEDGAYYLDLSAVCGGDRKFFFTRKDGTSLYCTRDLAYHLDKFARCEHAINVLGEDHKLEARELKSCLELLGARKTPEILFYSFVGLEGAKMSTRKGTAVYLDELLEEAFQRAYGEVAKRRGSELTEQKMREIARAVAVGAVRYNIVKVQPEKAMVFRWEDALNFEGDSAPFIQYAHARACSILRKTPFPEKYDPAALATNAEVALIKRLANFPTLVKTCARTRKPYLLANYAYGLACEFNQFYRDCPVLRAEPPKRNARLALVNATRIVLRNALSLLGIAALPEM